MQCQWSGGGATPSLAPTPDTAKGDQPSQSDRPSETLQRMKMPGIEKLHLEDAFDDSPQVAVL